MPGFYGQEPVFLEKTVNVLIIAAHGSRKNESNLEVEKLARRLEEKLNHRFDRVIHAFLQIADPLLEAVLKDLMNHGVSRVVVFPFFIGSGSHILEDIPNLVNAAAKAHPKVEFKLTRQLGKIPAIDDVIINEVLT